MNHIILITFGLVLAACQRDEVLYQGKPVGYWIRQLKDADPKYRVHAAEALGEIGPTAAAAVPDLIETLSDSEEAVRDEAVDALSRIGVPAINPVVELLGDSNTQVAASAAVVLWKIGPTAVPRLREALHDSRPGTRRYATMTLGGLGSGAADAAEDLVELLGDPDTSVSRAATKSLAALGSSAIEHLAAALRRNEEPVRQLAVMALSKAESFVGVDTLLDLLWSGDAELKIVILRALLPLRDTLPPVMKAIREVASDDAHPARMLAASALAADQRRRRSVVTVQMQLVGSSYQFSPKRLTVSEGARVVFVNASGGPHNVSFWPDSVPPGGVAALEDVMPDQMAPIAGPLLVEPGARYSIQMDVPPGHYAFYCLPHLALGQTGTMTVMPAGSETPAP